MADDSYKTVPPLVAGVTDYEPWAANLPDWLKSRLPRQCETQYAALAALTGAAWV